MEINKLVTELGDEDFRVREKATKRLAEIGLADLDALQEAEGRGDPETKRRARLLISDISTAHRLSPRVQGMEFKLITDKEWTVPRPGEKTRINARLQITNTTDTVYRLYLYRAVKPVLTDSTGKTLSLKGGTERAALAETVSPPLKKTRVIL